VIVHKDIIQGTPDWLLVRKGKPTASNFSKIVTAAKCDLSKSADSYINELIGETFAPDFEPEFQGNWMTRRGTEMEPQARLAFQAHTALSVEQVGFVTHDNGILGCSPDGLIVDGGQYVAGVEIKCPAPGTHVEYVRAGGLPDTYKQQVHGSMCVTGIRQWHFWSYFPGMQPHHIVVTWDDYTSRMLETMLKFCEQYQKVYNEVTPKLKMP
jgi:hypothetical protein